MLRKTKRWGCFALVRTIGLRFWRAASLLAVCFCLAACATLPYSSPVQKSDIRMGSNQPLLGLNAPGPAVGAGPIEIVRGFIRACAAGYSDDFTVARSFLAPKAAVDWKPDSQVIIFDTNEGVELSNASDGSVEADAKAVGSVDSNGKYSATVATAMVQERFSLIRAADNQWRIADLEDGIILSQSAFYSIYASAPIFFLSSDHEALIPDLRWYPRRRMASYLANAVFAGPPRALHGAATSVFPPGTSLRGGTVEVFDGVANVSIDSTQPFTDPHTIALAYWQMGSTLRDVAGISSINLSLGNVPLENTQPVNEPAGVSNPVMVKDGNLVRLDGDKIELLVSSSNLSGISIAKPAVSTDAKTLVFLDAAQQNLYYWNRRSATVLYTGRDLRPPSVDRLGWVWTADGNNPGQVLALKPDGRRIALNFPWQDSRTVTFFAVSPDGARLATIRRVDGKDQVSLVVIMRNQAGDPESLANARDIDLESNQVVSLAWLPGGVLSALTGSEDKTMVRIVPLFGPASSLPGVKDAGSLAAGRTENDILLATVGGELYQRSGRNWQHTMSGVHDPTFPG